MVHLSGAGSGRLVGHRGMHIRLRRQFRQRVVACRRRVRCRYGTPAARPRLGRADVPGIQLQTLDQALRIFPVALQVQQAEQVGRRQLATLLQLQRSDEFEARADTVAALEQGDPQVVAEAALGRPQARRLAQLEDRPGAVAIAQGEQAEAVVRMRPETLQLIQDGGHPKGDVFAVARIAGIQAAKRTHELIPLCHPLLLTSVKLELQAEAPDAVRIRARCRLAGQTGVEMEALTAASVAALTIYDMCKAVDRGMVIEQVQLLEKLGGKSGHYRKEEEGQA